jgi:hypothetical protein
MPVGSHRISAARAVLEIDKSGFDSGLRDASRDLHAFGRSGEASLRGLTDAQLRVKVAENELAGTLALDEAQLEPLCEALVDYPPRTSDDPTIGLCWDACRLASVGVIPREYLSTEAAKGRGAALRAARWAPR